MSSLRVAVHVTGRPSSIARPGDDGLLGVQAGLAAEPTADVRRDHADLLERHAERDGEQLAQEVRHLRRAVDDQPAVVAGRGGRRVRLHRRHGHALVHVAATHDDVGVGEDVGVRPGRSTRARRCSPWASNSDRRAVGERVLGIDDDGQRVVVDHDGVGRVTACGRRLGDDGDDRLADEAHAVRRPAAGGRSRRAPSPCRGAGRRRGRRRSRRRRRRASLPRRWCRSPRSVRGPSRSGRTRRAAPRRARGRRRTGRRRRAARVFRAQHPGAEDRSGFHVTVIPHANRTASAAPDARPWWCRSTAPAPTATMGHGRRAVLRQAIRPRHVRRRQRRPSTTSTFLDARLDVTTRRWPRRARPSARSSTTISAPPFSNAWPSATSTSIALRCAGFNHVDLDAAARARDHGRAGAGVLAQRRRRAHAGADPRPQPPHPAGVQPRPRRQLLARRPARLRPRRQDGRRDRHRPHRRSRRPAALALSLRRARVRPVPRCRLAGPRGPVRHRGRGHRRPATC